MDALTPAEQRELQTRMERRQMKDFMNMYQRLVEKCFSDCVNDFTSKSLLSKEEGCVNRCVDKFFKGTERMQARFQELNAQMSAQGGFPTR